MCLVAWNERKLGEREGGGGRGKERERERASQLGMTISLMEGLSERKAEARALAAELCVIPRSSTPSTSTISNPACGEWRWGSVTHTHTHTHTHTQTT